VYDFIVITKYEIKILLIFLNVYTHVLYSMESPALSTHFSHLRGKRSIVALFLSTDGRFKEAVTAMLILSSD
jgi:hypothetical protein